MQKPAKGCRIWASVLVPVMGFADLSLEEIAEDYGLEVELICEICDRLKIPYQDIKTKLGLEDAKAIILEALPPTHT